MIAHTLSTFIPVHTFLSEASLLAILSNLASKQKHDPLATCTWRPWFCNATIMVLLMQINKCKVKQWSLECVPLCARMVPVHAPATRCASILRGGRSTHWAAIWTPLSETASLWRVTSTGTTLMLTRGRCSVRIPLQMEGLNLCLTTR